MLTQHHDDLWSVAAPCRFLGLHLGTRMTVVRLGTGELLVHSPVPIEPPLQAEIEALGQVRHIVCPNLYHHMFAQSAVAAFPGARLHGPARLHKKRRDLAFDEALTETPHPDWAGRLEAVFIQGSRLYETVFFHRPSRTLVSSDLVENFATHAHTPTRLYLKAAGIHGRVGWSRFLKILYRDKKAARASLDRILAWDFRRVILAHGDVLEHDAKDQVRQALAWIH